MLAWVLATVMFLSAVRCVASLWLWLLNLPLAAWNWMPVLATALAAALATALAAALAAVLLELVALLSLLSSLTLP